MTWFDLERRILKVLADKKRSLIPEGIDSIEFFWNDVIEANYGVDLPVSFFSEQCEQWNLNSLKTLLDDVGEIIGVTSPLSYVGCYGSSFGFHVEDHHLYAWI